MGVWCLPLPSFPLNVLPQIDRGIDYEHKGHGVEMLIVALSTCLI